MGPYGPTCKILLFPTAKKVAPLNCQNTKRVILNIILLFGYLFLDPVPVRGLTEFHPPKIEFVSNFLGIWIFMNKSKKAAWLLTFFAWVPSPKRKRFPKSLWNIGFHEQIEESNMAAYFFCGPNSIPQK